MAGSLNKGAETDDLAKNHEINVTPVIDVLPVRLDAAPGAAGIEP